MADRLLEEASRVLNVIGGTEETIILSRVPDYIVIALGVGDTTFLRNAMISQGEDISWDDITDGSFVGNIFLHGNNVYVGYYSGGAYAPTLTVKAYIGSVMVDDITLSNIADAIRGINGTEGKYLPSEMAAAIANIATVVAEIEASGGNLEALIDRSITEINSTVEKVGKNAFRECKSLISATFPNALRVDSYGFSECTALSEINFPAATLINSYTFYKCNSLSRVVFPSVTQVSSNAFASCLSLQEIDLPKAKNIGSSSFYGSYVLKSVILRNTTMCTLTNSNAFGNCYHFLGTAHETYNPDGLKDGYIYVPSALVDEYKADSYWASFSTQIRALEDYTVDGTTTGALDESKI